VQPLPLAFNHERHLIAEEMLALRGRVPTGARAPLVFRFNIDVDRDRVERALNATVRRHSALSNPYGPSTRYDRLDRMVQLELFARRGLFIPGLYVQRLRADARIAVAERCVPDDDHLAELIREELATPLETTTGPALRASLVSVGSEATLVVVVLTHHTMDGWSMGVLMREFATLLADPQAELAPVALQYHQFAAWQLYRFREGGFAADERYWHEQWARLGDAKIRLRDLPFTTPHDQGSEFSEQMRMPFSADETTHIRTLIADLRLTPYVLFRTVMTIVLHHYARKARVAFWGNFTNRRHPEFLSALGWYSNTHIVTVAIDRSMTCAALAGAVATAVSEAQAHEALPLTALWQRLGYTLDTHVTRVNFDVLVARRRSSGSLPVELAASPVAPRGMDLDIRLWEDRDVLALIATFAGRRYRRTGVKAMLASMRRIVLAFAGAPALRVSDCERFMEDEHDGSDRDTTESETSPTADDVADAELATKTAAPSSSEAD